MPCPPLSWPSVLLSVKRDDRTISENPLPPARREHVLLFKLAHINAAHRFAKLLMRLKDCFRIVEVCRSLYNSLGARFRIAGLEDARAHENRFRTKSADERRIRRCGDAASGKIRHRQFARLGNLADQI